MAPTNLKKTRLLSLSFQTWLPTLRLSVPPRKTESCDSAQLSLTSPHLHLLVRVSETPLYTSLIDRGGNPSVSRRPPRHNDTVRESDETQDNTILDMEVLGLRGWGSTGPEGSSTHLCRVHLLLCSLRGALCVDRGPR